MSSASASASEERVVRYNQRATCAATASTCRRLCLDHIASFVRSLERPRHQQLARTASSNDAQTSSTSASVDDGVVTLGHDKITLRLYLFTTTLTAFARWAQGSASLVTRYCLSAGK